MVLSKLGKLDFDRALLGCCQENRLMVLSKLGQLDSDQAAGGRGATRMGGGRLEG